MFKIKNHLLVILISLVQIILFSVKINAEITNCPKSTPIYIKSTDSCEIKYCKSDDFSSGECTIFNDKVKIQWLNNIITISDFNFRYVNFGKYENGDMVIGTTEYPETKDREFYGIKYNGRPFFIKESKETPYYKTEIPDDEYGLFEGDGIIVKTQPERKEYYFYLSKLYNAAEMLDLENGNKYYTPSATFGDVYLIYSLRHAIVEINDENDNYYYIIGFVGSKENENPYIYLRKYIFVISSNSFYQSIKTVKIENYHGYMFSCFKTSNSQIICFYMSLVTEVTFFNYQDKIYLNLIKYSSELSEEITDSFEITFNEPYSFHKCIHLTNKVGAFAYFDNYLNSPRVHILFKEFKDNKFENYLPNSDLISNSIVVLKPTDIENYLLLNDIVKISDNNICFISTSKNKETIYIVTIKLFGEKKIKLRYYYLPTFKLYNYKILFEQRIETYKNFLAFSSSFCPNEECDSDGNEHYSGLMIFSYPNGTDHTLNIEKYLLENNNILINDLEFDLHDYIVIENNIFGYIYDTILIQNIEGYDNLKLYSSINPTEEIINYKAFEENEKIIIEVINTDNIYGIINCKLEYIYKVNNPNLNTFDSYADDIEGDDDADDYSINEYIGRLTYYKIILNNELSNICDDINCILCLKLHKNYCITCKYEYNITKDDNEQYYKKCLNDKFTEIETEMTDKIIDENECSIEEILDNKCTEGLMGENQLAPIYDYMKDKYLNASIIGNQKIIQTKNVLLQLSSNEEQKNYNNPNISSIDLLECEEKLKEANYIDEDDDLIILKTDIKSTDLTQTYVQYEIYNPIDLTPLDLSICKDATISINAPVKLDDSTSSLYENLKKSGYNLFKYNNSFYTDICTVYTSETGTDMLLEDRKKEIYQKSGNKTLCQSGCELLNYDLIQGKAECKCFTQKNKTNVVSLNNDNEFMVDAISDSFIKTLKNSNFKVLKCYKIAFDMKTLAKNVGRIFMSIIIILNFMLTIIFCFVDFKNINRYLVTILNRKMIYIKNFYPKALKNSKISKKNSKKMKSFFLKKNKSLENSNNKAPPKKAKIISHNSNKDKFLDKISKINDINFSVKNLLVDDSLRINKKLLSDRKEANINIIPINNLNLVNNNNQSNVSNNNIQLNDSNSNEKNNIEKKSNNQKSNIKTIISQNKVEKTKNKIYMESNDNDKKINPIENEEEQQKKISVQKKHKGKSKRKCNSMNLLLPSKKRSKKSIDKFTKKRSSNLNSNDLNDHELNTLEYELAIEVDKRTYIQYYWSLLKRKQLILFSFYPINDYNLVIIKMCLFLISFSLYITINGFFFSDEAMHKIHENKGTYKILNQIPKIMYSCLVSTVINMILKQLSLSESSLIEIKKEGNKKRVESKAKEVVGFLKIKFLIFYVIDYSLLFFFWYFLSCFCGVYKNTQITLFKDSLISFGISMLYPFGINLFPGMFRMTALRAKKKDKETLYKAGNLLALI